MELALAEFCYSFLTITRDVASSLGSALEARGGATCLSLEEVSFNDEASFNDLLEVTVELGVLATLESGCGATDFGAVGLAPSW